MLSIVLCFVGGVVVGLQISEVAAGAQASRPTSEPGSGGGVLERPYSGDSGWRKLIGDLDSGQVSLQRQAAAGAIILAPSLKGTPVVGKLHHLLQTCEEPQLLVTAVRALCEIDDETTRAEFSSLINRPNCPLPARYRIAVYLGARGELRRSEAESVVGVYIAALGDTTVYPYGSGFFQPAVTTKNLSQLARLYELPDPGISQHESPGERIKKAQQWWNQHRQAFLENLPMGNELIHLFPLGKAYDKEQAVRMVGELLASADPDMQHRGLSYAKYAGQGLIDTSVGGMINRLLTTPGIDPKVQYRAADCLAMVGYPESREALKGQMASSDNPSIRLLAAKYVGRKLRRDEADLVVSTLIGCLENMPTSSASHASADSERVWASAVIGAINSIAKAPSVTEIPIDWASESSEGRVRFVKEWWGKNRNNLVSALDEHDGGPQASQPS